MKYHKNKKKSLVKLPENEILIKKKKKKKSKSLILFYFFFSFYFSINFNSLKNNRIYFIIKTINIILKTKQIKKKKRERIIYYKTME